VRQDRVSPPGALANSTSAEVPAPQAEREVFLRDYSGENPQRIPIRTADFLVSQRLADSVSKAGHVRLKPGIRGIKELLAESSHSRTWLGPPARKSPVPSRYKHNEEVCSTFREGASKPHQH
jgi:hypothetical protein